MLLAPFLGGTQRSGPTETPTASIVRVRYNMRLMLVLRSSLVAGRAVGVTNVSVDRIVSNPGGATQNGFITEQLRRGLPS